MSAGPPGAEARAARVVAVAALCVAVTGYAVGLAQVPRPERRAGGRTAPAAAADVAPQWSALRPRTRGPNVAWRTRVPTPTAPSLATSAALGSLVAPAAATDPASRAAALARRAARRAYDGAPPVVPHPVDPTSVAACTACHEHGLRVGAPGREVVAPAMPHAAYASCTQCHAPGPPEAVAGWTDEAPANLFRGLAAPERGDRAWPGAPPVIPHATSMRERCLSCHGPDGAAGLRSTHPWRQSCTQCHAPRAQSP